MDASRPVTRPQCPAALLLSLCFSGNPARAASLFAGVCVRGAATTPPPANASSSRFLFVVQIGEFHARHAAWPHFNRHIPAQLVLASQRFPVQRGEPVLSGSRLKLALTLQV